jgi:hypothetical protein
MFRELIAYLMFGNVTRVGTFWEQVWSEAT